MSAPSAPPDPDLAYWKRRVVHSCIYGVDLNPLAVDLAKLSLWLTTLAADRPLSFLDHHLRVGNALVGAALGDLSVNVLPEKAQAKKAKKSTSTGTDGAAGQLSLLTDDSFRQSMGQAVSSMWLIEGSDAETVAAVKQQEELYTQIRGDLTRRFKRLADAVTAVYFGVPVEKWLWTPLADFATGRVAKPQLPRIGEWLEAAETLSVERRFFHWPFEFPEIYFDEFGRPLGADGGFDAVIGNPPYIRQEELAPFKPYFQTEYPDVFHGSADLYIYFYAQALRQLRKGGRMAYISSGTFTRSNFGGPFRQSLPQSAHLEQIVDFGENQPFEGAEMVRPSIVVLRRGKQEGPFRSLFLSEKIPESLTDAMKNEGITCDASSLAASEWSFQSADLTQLFQKVMAQGRPLKEVVEGKLFYGVKTGLNEAFLIDTPTRNRLIAEDPSCEPLLKRMLRGEDLRPWYQEDEGRWLIFTRRGIDIDAYPSVKAHLERFREQLEPQPKNWDTRKEWPGRKQGSYKWYEIQDTVDYYASFVTPKLFWPDITKLPRFSYDETGRFINDKGSIVAVDDPALLAVLQSRVTWFAISQIALQLRLRAGLWQYQLKSQFVERLPIPPLDDDSRAALADLARAITAHARERYALHEKARRRLRADLLPPGKTLNNRLSAWWELPDLAALRAELQKTYKTEIPVKDRDDWDEWLTDRKREHARLTGAIVAGETELNARVYALFALTPDEITLIEETTRYRYGEV